MSKSDKFHIDHVFFNAPQQFGDLLIYQIGERFCSNGNDTPAHRHGAYYELTFTISGKARVRLDDTEFCVRENDFFLSLPGEEHAMVSDMQEPFRYFYMAFSFTPESDCAPFFSGEVWRRLPCTDRVRHTPELRFTFTELLGRIDDCSPRARLWFQHATKALALSLSAAYDEKAGPAYTSPTVQGRHDLALRALQYFDSHMERVTRTQDIAAALGYTPAYLSRVFHREMGMPLSTYCTQRRLEQARTMLLSGEDSITAIAARLQYTSVYAFSRAFKHRFGESPRTHRAHHTQK